MNNVDIWYEKAVGKMWAIAWPYTARITCDHRERVRAQTERVSVVSWIMDYGYGDHCEHYLDMVRVPPSYTRQDRRWGCESLRVMTSLSILEKLYGKSILGEIVVTPSPIDATFVVFVFRVPFGLMEEDERVETHILQKNPVRDYLKYFSDSSGVQSSIRSDLQ